MTELNFKHETDIRCPQCYIRYKGIKKQRQIYTCKFCDLIFEVDFWSKSFSDSTQDKKHEFLMNGKTCYVIEKAPIIRCEEYYISPPALSNQNDDHESSTEKSSQKSQETQTESKKKT